jgi:hypothetical protein
MNWTADYNLLLAADNQSLELDGWVTLSNTSGASLADAQVKLVAGDVNRLQVTPESAVQLTATNLAQLLTYPDTGGVEQREFFEYQLYEIQRAVTVANNETKQVEFVTGVDVPSQTYYVFDASDRPSGYSIPLTEPTYGSNTTDVQNWLKFSTGEENGLGADLPAGRIRVYLEDVDGAALLIGESRINHTPEGEDVEIFLGTAFDLVGERTQMDFQRLSSTVLEETYEIRLRNRKDDETVEIRVPERLFRWSDWEIVDSSHVYTQLDAMTIEFRVDVAPDEETVITYAVRYALPTITPTPDPGLG